MTFPPRSPGCSVSGKSYLLSCPFKEKDKAKELGAKWDGVAGSWYVPRGQPLEPFNKWHPNGRKYIVCSYSEKDQAKRAGARWDASCKQWYFEANSKLESKLAKWLPSLSDKRSKIEGKVKEKSGENPGIETRINCKTKDPTKSQITSNPRINSGMTMAQLQVEHRARDPRIKGISTKNQSGLPGDVKSGSTWISSGALAREDCISFSQCTEDDSIAVFPSSKIAAPITKTFKVNSSAAKSESKLKNESSEDYKRKAKKIKTEASQKKHAAIAVTRSIKQEPSVPLPSQTTSVGCATSTQYTKITRQMPLKALYKEATARQLVDVPESCSPDMVQSLQSKEAAINTLDALVEGSICVHQSPEYKAYEKLLERVDSEENALRKTYHERLHKERDEEGIVQDGFSTISQRNAFATMETKKEGKAEYSESEDSRGSKGLPVVGGVRPMQGEESDSEDEYDRRFNAKKQFPENIRNVKGKHLDANSSEMEYTVWCSDGYDNDGWHSYHGPPDKEFDSVWGTKDEANARAKFLFFWRNPWDMGVEHMHFEEEWDESTTNGLKGWSVSPDDSSRWTVGVVPSAAYPHLENSTTKRHTNDRPEKEPVKNFGYPRYYGYY